MKIRHHEYRNNEYRNNRFRIAMSGTLTLVELTLAVMLSFTCNKSFAVTAQAQEKVATQGEIQAQEKVVTQGEIQAQDVIKIQEDTNTQEHDGYKSIYVHDPRFDAKAMEDIVVNPNAIYGFSPDPESKRLGEYASYDWTDPEVVEKARQDRISYLAGFDAQYALWDKMNAEGKSVEEIARAVSAKRNESRLASYKNDPVGLEKVKKSNLETYGNENGPTADSLYEKYGSWETVIIKSFSSNSGMDACLGLYDAQYEHNKLTRAIVENGTITYTVRPNDYLVKIAEKYYGDQRMWTKIYSVNKDKIGEAYTIYIGEELIIP